MAGIGFEAGGEFSVKDVELASLRKTRNLVLHQDDFERTLLTMVYTAHQIVNSTTEHQRGV